MEPKQLWAMRRRSEETEEQAAEWAAKFAAGALSAADQARFDLWYGADIRHAGAFARAQAILLRVGRLRAVGSPALRGKIAEILQDENFRGESFEDETAIAGHSAAAFPAAGAKRVMSWSRRQALLAGGAAASAAAAAGVLFAVAPQKVSSPTGSGPAAEVYTTRIGETRTVHLADGSVVTLNTNSRIAVHYSKASRNIRLEQGEGLFQVAKNKERPFIVTASGTAVRAVGTSFIVRRLPQQLIQVLVREGTVEVMHPGSRKAQPVRATAEMQALVAPNEPIAVRTLPRVQIERNLAWQYGKIAFENVSLAEAAAEFARYSGTKITVDPGIAGRTITGLYASNDPVGFAKAAASVLDLHVEIKSNEVWIIR